MERELSERCDRICQKLALFEYVGEESCYLFEDLCRSEGVSFGDVEYYLFETFGMSSSEIIEALNNM